MEDDLTNLSEKDESQVKDDAVMISNFKVQIIQVSATRNFTYISKDDNVECRYGWKQRSKLFCIFKNYFFPILFF